MKKIVCSVLFLIIVLSGVWAQQYMPEMGMALRLDNRDDRLFVNHPHYPFGTRLKIINLLNQMELELTVEGKPNTNTWALIEISSLASDFIGVPRGVLNQVRIEVMAVPTAAPAMRPRIGSFSQSGNAVVQGSSTELTASHPSIPIGRDVVLTNSSNGRSITVSVTARSRAATDRIIEISPAAGRSLGISGVGQVRLQSGQ